MVLMDWSELVQIKANQSLDIYCEDGCREEIVATITQHCEQIDSNTQEIADQRTKLTKLEEALTKTKKECQVVKQSEQEYKKYLDLFREQTDNEDLKTVMEEFKKHQEHHYAKIAELHSLHEANIAKLSLRLNNDITKLRVDLNKLQDENTQLRGENTQLRGDLNKLQDETTQLRKDLNAQTAQSNGLEQLLRDTWKQHDETIKQIREMNLQIVKLQSANR